VPTALPGQQKMLVIITSISALYSHCTKILYSVWYEIQAGLILCPG